MQHFFSPSTGGFYNEAIHGFRQVADPLTDAQIKAGRNPRYRANPACIIPKDAIPIDEKAWRRLLAAQGEGKVLTVEAGQVVAIDPPKPSAEDQLAQIRARRDRLLKATDIMVAAPDYPITEAQRDDVIAWRAALRDFPDEIAPLLPSAAIDWPARPSWIGEQGEKL